MLSEASSDNGHGKNNRQQNRFDIRSARNLVGKQNRRPSLSVDADTRSILKNKSERIWTQKNLGGWDDPPQRSPNRKDTLRSEKTARFRESNLQKIHEYNLSSSVLKRNDPNTCGKCCNLI